jgi:hypothetical protein
LTWKVLDPADFFEANFLVGTDLDQRSLSRLMRIDGLVAGPIGIAVSDFETWMSSRDLMSQLIGAPIVFGGILFLIFITLRYDAGITRYFQGRSFPVRIASMLGIVVVVLGVPTCIGIVVGPAVASRIYSIPNWAQPAVFPPYFLEKTDIWDWSRTPRN